MVIKIIGSRAANPIGTKSISKCTSARFCAERKCFQIDVGNNFIDNGEVNYLFVTHLHDDHVGKIDTVPKSVKIFVPSSSFEKYLCNKTSARIFPFKPRRFKEFNSFKILAFPVKHSKTTKTYSYLIKCAGKRTLWMSDFRNFQGCTKYFKNLEALFLEASSLKRHIMSRGSDQTGHMAVMRSLEVLRQNKIDPKRIYLVHVGKSLMPIEDKLRLLQVQFPKFNIDVAYDGQKIIV